MNYGGGSAASSLAVTGLGVGIAGHNLTLGIIIATAAVLLAGGCALYRFGTKGRRIHASQ